MRFLKSWRKIRGKNIYGKQQQQKKGKCRAAGVYLLSGVCGKRVVEVVYYCLVKDWNESGLGRLNLDNILY